MVSESSVAGWGTVGRARLAELEAAHATLTGPGPGRRWGTTQINRSPFLALVAQFQSFSRGVHDEAVLVYVAESNVRQQAKHRGVAGAGSEAGHA